MTQTLQPVGDTGFSWMRASVDVEKYVVSIQKMAPVTDESHIILVGLTSDMEHYKKDIETASIKIRHLIRDVGFRPFDYYEYFPNKDVKTLWISKQFDLDAWARTQVDIPTDVDVSFVYNPYGKNKAIVIAKTLKKGKIVKIKAVIEGALPFKCEAEAILKNFQKKAPAPPIDFEFNTSEYSCYTYVSNIMKMIDKTGRTYVKNWIEQISENRDQKNSNCPTYLTIPGACIINGNIEEITFTPSGKSNAIHCHVKFPGGHSLKDDDSGITVTLDAEFPEIIISSMKSKNINEIIDLPWLSSVITRTRPVQKDGKLTFRAFSDNVPFFLYDPVPLDKEEIEARIKNAFVQNRYDSTKPARWKTIETTLIPIFNSISREELSIILVLLEHYDKVDLKDFGYEKWELSGTDGRINALKRPDAPIKGLGFATLE
jgi:hypothetical protein